MKRALDILISVPGLILLALPLAFVALAVHLDSPGAALFRQERIGKDDIPFEILKFRTMYIESEGMGITVGADARITRVGSFLRKYKLDELPQLWNVLRGDMSLVGPRPEVRQYAFILPEQEIVRSVRPGITDPISVHLKDESEILAQQPDPEKYYREVLLPQKAEGYLRYLDSQSLRYDLGVIIQTLKEVFFKRNPQRQGNEEV